MIEHPPNSTTSVSHSFYIIKSGSSERTLLKQHFCPNSSAVRPNRQPWHCLFNSCPPSLRSFRSLAIKILRSPSCSSFSFCITCSCLISSESRKNPLRIRGTLSPPSPLFRREASHPSGALGLWVIKLSKVTTRSQSGRLCLSTGRQLLNWSTKC